MVRDGVDGPHLEAEAGNCGIIARESSMLRAAASCSRALGFAMAFSMKSKAGARSQVEQTCRCVQDASGSVLPPACRRGRAGNGNGVALQRLSDPSEVVRPEGEALLSRQIET